MDDKKWYTSKTLWVNALALAGSILLEAFGVDVMTPEVQVKALVAINLVLRFVTKSPVAW